MAGASLRATLGDLKPGASRRMVFGRWREPRGRELETAGYRSLEQPVGAYVGLRSRDRELGCVHPPPDTIGGLCHRDRAGNLSSIFLPVDHPAGQELLAPRARLGKGSTARKFSQVGDEIGQARGRSPFRKCSKDLKDKQSLIESTWRSRCPHRGPVQRPLSAQRWSRATTVPQRSRRAPGRAPLLTVGSVSEGVTRSRRCWGIGREGVVYRAPRSARAGRKPGTTSRHQARHGPGRWHQPRAVPSQEIRLARRIPTQRGTDPRSRRK